MSEEKDRIFEKIQSNPQLQILLKKIRSGNADFKDTSQYVDLFSKIMGSEFSGIITEIPNGMRERLCTELLRGSYENINEILAQVQTSLDEKREIGIAPQKAEFPEERVQKIASSLEDETVPEEVIKRRADTGTANVTRSFHDDYIKKNAEFRSNAGLKCYLERETDGNCCSWCSALAGRFLIGEHPADIFRRHDNCGCTVVLIDGKTRQYAWSKKTWSREEERDYLKELDKKKKAKRLSREQARALQEKNLPKSLTNGDNSSIIKERIVDYNSAKRVLESKNVIFDSSLKNLDERCLVENAARLNELIEKFPSAKKYITDKKFTFKSGNGTAIGSCSYRYDGEAQSITLNAKYFQSFDKYIENQKAAIASKWKMPVSSENIGHYTVTHEFGHFIENIIIDSMKEEKGFSKMWSKASNAKTNSAAKKIIDKWYNSRAAEIRKEIVNIAHETDKKINNINYKKFVSDYGKTSNQEFFAEIFANSQGGEPNALGKAMIDYLGSVLK